MVKLAVAATVAVDGEAGLSSSSNSNSDRRGDDAGAVSGADDGSHRSGGVGRGCADDSAIVDCYFVFCLSL